MSHGYHQRLFRNMSDTDSVGDSVVSKMAAEVVQVVVLYCHRIQ